MSAKLTVAFFIVICFEIGALLVFLPWHRSWQYNQLLPIIADRLNWPSLAPFMMSGYIRGAVTGLGLLNIVLGVWEIVNFKKTVQAFQAEWQGEKPSSGISDHGPAEVNPEQ
jgi:hypothetical protein